MNVLAKVDASKEGELAKEHFIQGFPTLALFRYGEKVQKLAITIVLRRGFIISNNLLFPLKDNNHIGHFYKG